MTRKSFKALAVNGGAAFFAFLSLVGIFISFVVVKGPMGNESMSAFDYLRANEGYARFFLVVGSMLSAVLIVAGMLNWLGIGVYSFSHIVLAVIGVIIAVFSVVVLINLKKDIDDFNSEFTQLLKRSFGVGFWLYLFGAILAGIFSLGNLFIKD